MDESAATNVRLEKPYLRTSARLTVAHLKKYLAKKMKTSSEVAADPDPTPTFTPTLTPTLILTTDPDH